MRELGATRVELTDTHSACVDALLADPDGPVRKALLAEIGRLNPKQAVAELTMSQPGSRSQAKLIRESALGQQLRRIMAGNVVDNIDDFAAIAGVANDPDFRRHGAHASEGFAGAAKDTTRYLNPPQCGPGGPRSVLLRGCFYEVKGSR